MIRISLPMIAAGAAMLLGGRSGYANIDDRRERGEGRGHLPDRRSGAAGFPLGPGYRNRPDHDHNRKA